MYYYPQNYAGMPQQNYMNQQQNILKGRLVSSIDEAKAAQIDFDGSLFVYPDIANKKIYTKQILLDGTSKLNIYELNEVVPAVEQSTSYVTKDEFEKAIAELKKEQEKKKQEESFKF